MKSTQNSEFKKHKCKELSLKQEGKSLKAVEANHLSRDRMSFIGNKKTVNKKDLSLFSREGWHKYMV